MEFHFGVIRGKREIHAALQNSRSLNRQLAVCYADGGKLIVKICTVTAIENKAGDADIVTLRSRDGEETSDYSVPLSSIQSIYPIRDFTFEEPETSDDVN